MTSSTNSNTKSELPQIVIKSDLEAPRIIAETPKQARVTLFQNAYAFTIIGLSYLAVVSN